MSGFNEKFPKQMSLVSHYPRRTDPSPSFNLQQISWKLKIPFIFQENKQAMAISDCSSIFMNFCWLFSGGVHRMSNLYFGVKASWQVLLLLQKENYSLGETFFRAGSQRETTTIDWSWKAKPGHNTANWFSPRPWRLLQTATQALLT